MTAPSNFLFSPHSYTTTMKIEDEIKQKQFANIHHKAVVNLIFSSNWLLNRQQHFFKQFGITPQQYNILRILKGQYPGSISGTEIKSRMLDKNSDISRLLDRLVLKELIVKKVCPSDKRAADVFISPKGIDLLEKIATNETSMEQLLLLSEEEAAQLSDLLDKARG